MDIIKAETIAIDLLNFQAKREKEDNDRKRNNLQQEQIKHWCEEERQRKKIMLEIFERNFKNPWSNSVILNKGFWNLLFQN